MRRGAAGYANRSAGRRVATAVAVGWLVLAGAPAPTPAADPPKGKGQEALKAWKDATDDAARQAAGKRVMKEVPDAAETFEVVSTFLEKGWPVGKVGTSYDVLKHWTFDRVDGKAAPALRLGFIDLIEKAHATAPVVVDGGLQYARTWALNAAGRHAQAIEAGERYVARFAKGSRLDDVRLLVAQSMLALSPPDLAGARKQLKALVAMEKSPLRPEAERLLAAVESGGASVQLTEGFPKPEGLGKVVLLTNLPSGHALLDAVKAWREAKQAEVVRFEGGDVAAAAADLRKTGPEFVALVVEPSTVDVNFHLGVLETCRGLDADPMPDFHFGYLTARTPADLHALSTRSLLPKGAGENAAGLVALTPDGANVKPLDFVLHFGHGMPWSVVDGATGEQIAKWDLTRRPVVFSGACFNAVFSRSYHPCALQPVFLPPEEVAPERLVSLAWVRAGAAGLLAALEGDRGEMAMAEWMRFRATAEPLGAVIGHQYRLAFTSLPESYPGFPRYTPRAAKRMGFYDVMLRGMVSRLLLGDPTFEPLASPLDAPTTASSLEGAADGSVVATVEVLRFENGPFLNYLPESGRGVFDWRLTERVELPRGLAARLDAPTVAVVDAGGATVPFGRTQAKHEVWGGRRHVTVQVESTDGRLAKAGTRATFTFAVRR
jgi:hypothetical protein